MKELSIEEKAKRYDRAIKLAKDSFNYPDYPGFIRADVVFPELSESEDEKIRKALINQFSDYKRRGENHGFGYSNDKILAWLEKQGERNLIVPKFRIGDIITPKDKNEHYTITDIVDEWYEFREKHINGGIPIYYQDEWEVVGQKPMPIFRVGETIIAKDGTNIIKEPFHIDKIEDDYYWDGENTILVCNQDEFELVEQKSADKIEPKFHEGDWVIQGCSILKIKCVGDTHYCFETVGGYVDDMLVSEIDSQFHLWTIQDAKDGDVLAAHECYVIFKEIDGLNIKCYCTYHYLGFNPIFYVNTLQNKEAFQPATKKQRDALMKAMSDAGYTFDFEKKEFKKIEQKPMTEKFEHELAEICNQLLSEIDSEWMNNEILNCIGTSVWLNLCDETAKRYKDGLLKLAKQGEQKPTEWSEEDEKMLNDILMCGEHHCYLDARNIAWLKFLKERYTWKPSDEQITWLYRAADNASKDSRMKQILNELLSDLKKLRGE